MSNKFKETCRVSKWFWGRIVLVILLFIGLGLYFFYDWKIGYPKKNYQRAQYETFEKARDYFVQHVKMGGSAEQWTAFAKEQDIEHFQNSDLVQYQYKNDTWPVILGDYSLYKKAYESKGAGEPVLWKEYLIQKQRETAVLKKNAEGSNEARVAYEKAIRWDKPLPSEFKKKDYEANYRLSVYKSFQEAEETFKNHQKLSWGEYEWELYASYRDLAFPEVKSILPEAKQNEKWPVILSDYNRFYEAAKDDIEKGVEIKDPYLWKEFSSEIGIGEKPASSFKEKKKVNEQLYFGIGMITLSFLTSLFALRMKRRFMAVDDEAYYAPGSKKILYSDIFKIDKRKWDNKGLATLYYKDGSAEKKVRFDGMVYGGLDKKDGEPAEKVFQVIMNNFKGEVVDYEEEDPDYEKIKD